MNGKCLKGLFHEEVVRSLKELPVEVCLVCARKVTGPSPLRGTIVDNVDTGRSEQAFASRVRNFLKCIKTRTSEEMDRTLHTDFVKSRAT